MEIDPKEARKAEIEMMLEELLSHEEASFYDFVRSLEEFFINRGYLTERQLIALRDIYRDVVS